MDGLCAGRANAIRLLAVLLTCRTAPRLGVFLVWLVNFVGVGSVGLCTKSPLDTWSGELATAACRFVLW